jgi:hypothetical protein
MSESDDTASFKAQTPSLSFPATFWGAVVALISWPFIALGLALGLATSLAMIALMIVGLVVAALLFVALGIPCACVLWAVMKILD